MDKDILKKAVELADGWEWVTYSDSDFIELEKADGAYWYDDGEPITPENMPRILKDALAAQLFRQLQATGNASYVEGYSPLTGNKVVITDWVTGSQFITKGHDRTENTITVVVESKVLEKGEGNE